MSYGVVRGKASGRELSQLRTDVHRRSDCPARVLMAASFKRTARWATQNGPQEGKASLRAGWTVPGQVIQTAREQVGKQ